MFPTLKHQRHCSALVLGPDPSRFQERPDLAEEKARLVEGAPGRGFSSHGGSPVVTMETSFLNHFDTYGGKCTYDFPIFRTVPIKIATLKVPSHNEYSSPGTSIGTWMLPQKWQPNDKGLLRAP